MLWSVHGHEKKNRNVADIFRQHVNRHPNKICFIFEDQEWTFQQVQLIFTEKEQYFHYKAYSMKIFYSMKNILNLTDIFSIDLKI